MTYNTTKFAGREMISLYLHQHWSELLKVKLQHDAPVIPFCVNLPPPPPHRHLASSHPVTPRAKPEWCRTRPNYNLFKVIEGETDLEDVNASHIVFLQERTEGQARHIFSDTLFSKNPVTLVIRLQRPYPNRVPD